MKDESMLLEGIYAMLEEMHKKLSRTEATTPPAAPTVDLSGIERQIGDIKKMVEGLGREMYDKIDSIENVNDLSELTSKMNQIIEKPPVIQQQELYHFNDTKSSIIIKTILLQWAAILFLTIGSAYIIHENWQMRDNNLKYRYLKMLNRKNESIWKLEDTFEYNRDKKRIKEIREEVNEYESALKKNAERLHFEETFKGNNNQK